MTKGDESHPMANANQSDGLSGCSDLSSPSSHYSSESSPPSTSGSCRGHHRSSSSSSGSSSRSRSRSHPRCHRHSHCRSHRYNRDGRPSRSYRARSRSYSRSPSPDRYCRSRRRSSSRSRSRFYYRSSMGWRRRSTAESRFNRFSRSPPRSYRSSSGSSGSSVILSLEDKQELLKTAKVNAMRLLGVEKLELPESVKPILPEEPEWEVASPEPWVRPHPEKVSSKSSEAEAATISLKMSPKAKAITFSINNCVAKPTVTSPSSGKLTARVDSYESRKPYGHWIPVTSSQSSSARKQTRNKSH